MRWKYAYVTIYILTIAVLVLLTFIIPKLKPTDFVKETIIMLLFLASAFIMILSLDKKKLWSLKFSFFYFIVMLFNGCFLYFVLFNNWLIILVVLSLTGAYISLTSYLLIQKEGNKENSLEFLKNAFLSNLKDKKRIPSILKKQKTRKN